MSIMTIICSADTCLSNETTQVNGRSIKFYSFPNDDKLRKQWQTICKSVCTICTSLTNNNLFRLCELHFEKKNFNANMELKSNAVPTVFDFPKKRKTEITFPISNTYLDSPVRRHKLENKDSKSYKNENISTAESNTIFTSTPLPVKVELQKPLALQPQSLNDSLSSVAKSAVSYHCPYRLLIQIDKIRSKPGPKSKKLLCSAHLANKSKNANNIHENLNENLDETTQENLRASDLKFDYQTVTESNEPSPAKSGQTNVKKANLNLKKSNRNNIKNSSPKVLNKSSQNNLNISSQSNFSKSDQNSSNKMQIKPVQENVDQASLKSAIVKKIETLLKPPYMLSVCKNGCELQNVIFNNIPAFRCGKCNNIYIPQPVNEAINTEKQLIHPQIQANLTCDICYSIFKTQFEYRNHMRLHAYMNPSTPFQCHLCELAFAEKPKIRKHILEVHGIGTARKDKQFFSQHLSVDLKCNFCNLIFRNEEHFRRHMNSHEENDKPVLPLRQFTPVKFSCTVCSMEFTTLAEVQAHAMTHKKTNIQDLRCNICSQVFPSDQILTDHLREHVAEAHRCHLCPKAFVNKSSLQTHLQNHI